MRLSGLFALIQISCLIIALGLMSNYQLSEREEVTPLQTPDVLWSKTFGGSDLDSANSITKCDDGGFALAGYTNSFDSSAVWLIRTDADGNHVWNQTYNLQSYESAESVVLCDNGGFAITGTRGTYQVGYNTFLIRTDTDGNQLWNQTYNIAAKSWSRKVIQCSDGGFAVVGTAESLAEDCYIYLLRTDTNGNQLWGHTFGSSGHDSFGKSCVECSDGGFAIIGYTNTHGAGGHDGWLIRTNRTGHIQWSHTYGGSDDDYCMGIVQCAGGGYSIAGVTGSYDVRAGDIWLIRTDITGNLLWNRTYGGTHMEHTMKDSLIECSEGGFAITGYYYEGQSDVLLIRTDQNGNQLWNLTYGGLNKDEGCGIVEGEDGSLFIGGYTESFGAGNFDALLLKIGLESRDAFDYWHKGHP
jgi:hypothetical protein